MCKENHTQLSGRIELGGSYKCRKAVISIGMRYIDSWLSLKLCRRVSRMIVGLLWAESIEVGGCEVWGKEKDAILARNVRSTLRSAINGRIY